MNEAIRGLLACLSRVFVSEQRWREDELFRFDPGEFRTRRSQTDRTLQLSTWAVRGWPKALGFLTGRNKNRRIRWFALVTLLTGCATGFHREALQERLADQPFQVSDEEIRAALEQKPQIRFPIKLAVHMIAETDRSGGGPPYLRPAEWRWSLADVERIDQWSQSLRQAGITSDMYVMSQLVAAKNDLRSVRLAAAKHGADAVLVIKGVAEIDAYVNPGVVLNLLILPGYLVPASHRDVLFMVRGAMWDVGNEFLYLSVDAEGESRTRKPTFRVRESDAVDAAKSLAMESFGKEFMKRMHALKSATGHASTSD